MSRWFAKRPFTINSTTPLISFTFDDFPRSALLAGGAILREHGMAGTYYASLGLMGSESPSGCIFEANDILKLIAEGHELGCHTYSHCHAWDTPPAVFEQSIIANRKALEAIAPGHPFRSHSYPISCPRPGIKRRSAGYFAACRAGGQTYNSGTIDLNNLQAFFIEQSRDNPDAIREVIDSNCRAGGWLIFATHDVCENPSRFGCQPGLFEEIVKCSVNSGAKVLSMSEGLKSIGALN